MTAPLRRVLYRVTTVVWSSQMDVPTRQAYVIELVDPDERVGRRRGTRAPARYAVRPIAPVLGGVLQQVALGLPLVVAGGIKTAYDLALWSWFRRVPLPSRCHPEEVLHDPVPADGPGVRPDQRRRFLQWDR